MHFRVQIVTVIIFSLVINQFPNIVLKDNLLCNRVVTMRPCVVRSLFRMRAKPVTFEITSDVQSEKSVLNKQ